MIVGKVHNSFVNLFVKTVKYSVYCQRRQRNVITPEPARIRLSEHDMNMLSRNKLSDVFSQPHQESNPLISLLIIVANEGAWRRETVLPVLTRSAVVF